MNTSEFLAWLCADRAAFSVWKAAHLRQHPDHADLPDYKLSVYYTLDEQISGYWQSPLGKLNRWIILFWMRVQRPRLRWHFYWLRWRFRMIKARAAMIWDKILF